MRENHNLRSVYTRAKWRVRRRPPIAGLVTHGAGKKRVWVLALAAMLCAPASAQMMFKCITPSGGVEYRGSPCEGTSRVSPMAGGTISKVDGMSRHEIQRALRQNTEAQPQYQSVQQQETGRAVPTDQDIKNMETSASSITLGKRDKMIRQAEIAAAKDRRIGGSGEVDYSAVNADDQRTAARRQAAAQQAAAQAQEMARAQEQQANRTFTQDSIRTCSFGNCRGSSGADYTVAPDGGFRRRDDGAKCRQVNGRLECF